MVWLNADCYRYLLFTKCMPYAAIYVPDFPVAAVVRMEPVLRDKAVAILQGTAPAVTVAAMNEAAAEIGIEFGMTKLQAAA